MKLKPWGFYITLLSARQWKVKLLYFRKNKSISYQKHNHRAELWLFVFGKGQLKLGENIYYQRHGGESSEIARGEWHQYTAEKPTLVIELQHGGACHEDDITRRPS